MPVEIRELTIKVQVDEQAGNNAEASSGRAGSGEKAAQLIKQAVDEVMRILESKKER